MMKTQVANLFFLATLCAFPVLADEISRPPVHYELKLVHIFEGTEPKHIFVIGDSGFTSVESLKGFLSTLPAGSSITWAPSCMRFGKEPLLSSEKGLEEFRIFLKQRGISFILVPSG